MGSPSTSAKKYHVFISFRGKDTRRGFTSFLYNALCDKRIETFIDEGELEKGDEISPVILGAIEASTISIIVFSENYAESRWCLDELNHILRCKEERGQLVLPVFYGVDPTNIRHQRGSFGAAFSEHEICFGHEPGKLDTWRESLTTSANLSGWNLADARSEPDLIKNIVESVTKKLQERISSSDNAEDLIGTENNIQKIESSLRIDLTIEGTRIVGIWGMGGIGKTTLARVLFERLSSQFSGSSFLENVSGEVEKHQLSDLQTRVFSELLNEKSLSRVTGLEKERLRRTNVLLVLDNVNHVKQLEYLAKDRTWFGPGSRIIVTSRDSQVLRNIAADEIHEVEELGFDDALRLFLSKSFQKEKSLSEEYSKLAKIMVRKYAKGNPLALTVLGRHLCSRNIEEWESEMELLGSTPNQEVQEILRVSYDGLSQNDKDIFLDIACFFKGEDRNSMQTILGYRYLGVAMGIRVLIDRALVTVNERGEILMHDLIQEMGQAVVSQQSIDPGERSRLWSTSDICHVLEENRGTKEIQGISLDCTPPSKITDSLTTGRLVFEKMTNLWFLHIYSSGTQLLFPEDPVVLPATLRYFWWNNCSWKSFPQSFNPKNLYELSIHGEELERTWCSEYKDLQNLEVLDLGCCGSLKELLDLSRASNLKHLDLSFCLSIDKFPLLPNPSNIEYLRMTKTKIEEVPTTIYEHKSLKFLSLERCSKLVLFPEILEPMKCLEKLLLAGTGIKDLHESIENLSRLEFLSLENCQNLEKIPDTIFNLRSLRSLILNDCPKLKCLPKIPLSIQHLDAKFCKSLESLSNAWIALAEGPPFIQCLDFSNCLKLNPTDILTEFQTRVLKLSRSPSVSICCVGEEIPEWFFTRSEESSVTVKLHPGWYNPGFTGFAVCAVISHESSVWTYQTSLMWTLCFATACGKILMKTCQAFPMHTFHYCDHIVIQSFGVDCSVFSSAAQISVEALYFRIAGSPYEPNKVRRCGVRLLYRQDAVEIQISNPAVSKPNSEYQLALNALFYTRKRLNQLRLRWLP